MSKWDISNSSKVGHFYFPFTSENLSLTRFYFIDIII